MRSRAGMDKEHYRYQLILRGTLLSNHSDPPGNREKWSGIDCCLSLREVNRQTPGNLSTHQCVKKRKSTTESGAAVRLRAIFLSQANRCITGRSKSDAGIKWCADKLSASCPNNLRIISVMGYPISEEKDDQMEDEALIVCGTDI